MSIGMMILIVEDEQDLASTIAFNLEREGYEAVLAHNGADAIEALKGDRLPDLVVLDLMLPDMSGTEICRQIRQDERTRAIPVIMATAKSEEIDRVVGFEVGADDYVVKPFSVRELMLRIRAILRRATTVAGEESEATEDNLEFGPLLVDTSSHRVWLDDEELKLTALEFKLLTTFMRRKGRVQTREILLQDVWGMSSNVVTRTVDTHVKRLREKLGDAGAFIETLRGVGYRFRESPDEV